MSNFISSNPRRTIVGLTTALAAAALAVGSGADFSTHSANPANTFSSGTLIQKNSLDGVAIVTGSNLKPGDVRTGEVKISNTGTIAGDFSLTETGVTNGFGAGDMTLHIQDVSGSSPTEVYNGDVGALTSGSIKLGSYAPGDAHTYRFTATLARSAPNADQGKSASATYEWASTPTR